MHKTLDLARYESHDPARLQQLHGAMVRAVSAAFPGLLHAELVRLQDGSFLDIMAWDSPASAEAAVEGECTIPEFIEFASQIANVSWSHCGPAASIPGSG